MPETLPSEWSRQYLTTSTFTLLPAGFRPAQKGWEAEVSGGKQDVVPQEKVVTKSLRICQEALVLA
jgi:hypothetical protein